MVNTNTDFCKYLRTASDGITAIGFCDKYKEADPYCPPDHTRCSGPVQITNNWNMFGLNAYLTTINKADIIKKLKGLNKLNHVTLLEDLSRLIKELEE